MKIDAHHHIWKYNPQKYGRITSEMETFQQDFLFPALKEIVAKHPGQTFVLGHIAKPKIRESLMTPWLQYIQRLAERENTYCKLSGLATEASWNNWTMNDLQPYFDVVLEAFGPKRLMFGSDWPVCNLAGGDLRWRETVLELISQLSADEQACILGGTAIAAYGLE